MKFLSRYEFGLLVNSFRSMVSYKKTLTYTLLLISLILCSCSSPEEKEAKYIKRGNELFEDGKYDKAYIEYKNALRINPTDPEISYRIALISEAKGDIHGAIGNFLNAEKQNVHYYPAVLKLAEYYIAGGDYEKAKQRLDSVLADSKDNPEAHALEAAFFLRQKNFDDTEKEARFALTKDPNNVTAFAVLTGLYMRENDIPKAETTVEDGIKHNPRDMSLLLLKANLYQQQEDLPKLTDAYQQIFTLKPTEMKYRYNLANIYIKANKLDDAEATLRAGLKMIPNDMDAKHGLIAFLADYRGLESAEKQIDEFREDAPDNDDFVFWLVDLDVTHNASDKAVALLKEIIAEDKDRFKDRGIRARAMLARLDLMKGDKTAAGDLVAVVLQHDPKNSDALYLKASHEVDQGSYQDAVADLRTIIHDKPKNKEAIQLLAETFFLQQHIDLAISTLNQLIEIDPLDLSARVRMAQMYHLSGNSKHAMDLLFLVTKADPKYAIGWESTARLAIDVKDWATAKRAIETLDTLPDQHAKATFLKGQVLTNGGDLKASIAQYKEVIAADPDSRMAEYALLSLFTDYSRLGQMDEALQYYQGLKSDNPFVTTLIGECYVKLAKKTEAAAAFDKAISQNPIRTEPYLDRANLYIEDHKIDQALNVLKSATLQSPGDPRPSFLAANALLNEKRYKDAIAVYEELLTRIPGQDTAANNYASLVSDFEYNDSAAHEKAHQVTERFMASTNPGVLDTIAWVYYRQGNIQQAQSIAARILAMGGKIPSQIHYHLGAIFLKAGQTAEAKTELQKAVPADADYIGLDEAKKLLSTN